MIDRDNMGDRYPYEDMGGGETFIEREERLFGGPDHMQTEIDGRNRA